MPKNSGSIILTLQAEKLGLKMSVTRNELPSGKTRNGLPRKDPSAYDQAMRDLAAITLLILALAMVQPVAAQGFKPDFKFGLRYI